MTRFTDARTSAIASVSTARRAWLRLNRSTDAERRSPCSPSASAFGPRTSIPAVTAAPASLDAVENDLKPRQASSPRTTTNAIEPATATNETTSASQTQVTGRMLSARAALARRRRGLLQIAIVLAAAGVYEAFRIAITPDWDAALGNARRIWEWEQALAVNVEQPLQRAFLAIPDAVEALNVFYFVGHFLLTGLFFVWLYRRSESGFASFRNGFFVATSIALIVHWQFPTAPPRLAGVGLVDTLQVALGDRHRLPLERGALEPGVRGAVAARGLRGRGGGGARALHEPALGARARRRVPAARGADDHGHGQPFPLRRGRRARS